MKTSKAFRRIFISVAVICVAVSTVFAAYGKIDGYVIPDGGVYGSGSSMYHSLDVSGSATETKAAASAVENIYARVDIVDADYNEIIDTGTALDHYVKRVTATAEGTYGYYEPEMTVSFEGLFRARYTDDTVSETTSALEGTVGGNRRSISQNTSDELTDKHYQNALALAQEKFNVDLSDYDYIDRSSLWSVDRETLTEDQIVMLHMLTDQRAEADVGDIVPSGVFYNDQQALLLYKTDGVYELRICSTNIPANARVSANGFFEDYIIQNIISEN